MIALVFLLFLIFLPGAWGDLSFTVYWPDRSCPLEDPGPYANPFPDGFEVWTEGEADVWTYPDSPRLESLTLDPAVAGRSLSNDENLYYDPETDAYVFTIRAKVASGITSASYPTGTYLVPIFSAGQSGHCDLNPRVNGQIDFLPLIPWNSCHTLDWYKDDPTAIDPVEQSGHWVGFTLIVPRSSTLIFNAEGVAIGYNPFLQINFDWFLVAVGAGDQGQDYLLARGYVDSINFIVTNQPEDIPEPPTPTPTPTLTKTPTPTFIPPTDTPTIPPTETPTPKTIKDLAVVGLKAVSHPSFVVVQGATFYFVAEVRNLGDVNFSGDVVVSATNMTSMDALGEHTIEGGISTLSRSKFLPFQIYTESLAQGSYQIRIKHDQTDDDPSNDTYTFYMGVLAPTPTPTPSPTHTYTPTSTPSPTFTPANTPVPGAVDIAVVRLKADSLEVVQGDNQPVYAEVRNEGSVVSSNFILSATNVTNGTGLGTYEISSLAPGLLVPERGWLFPSAGLDPGEYEVQVSHNYNSYGHSPADEVPGNDMASIVLTVVTPTPTPTNTPSPTSTPTPTETPSPTATATPWTGHYDIAALYILGATELVYPGDKGVYSACFINRGDIVSSTFYVTVENWTKGGEIIHNRLITETLETNQLFSVGFQLKSWELTPNILYRIHAQHWLSTDEVPENDQMDLFVYVVQPPTPTPVWAPPTRLPEIILPTPTPTREWSPPRTPTPTPTRSTPTPTASFTPRPTFTPTRTPYPLPTCDPVLPVCDYNGPPRLPPELEAINMAFRDLGLSAVAWSCHGLFDVLEVWDWLKMGGNLSVGGDALICGDLLVHGMINGVTVEDFMNYPSFGVIYDGEGRNRQAARPMDELGIISTDGFARIVLDSRTGYWNILRGPNAETSAGGEQAVATPWGPPTATPTPAVLVIEDDRGVTLEQPLDQPLKVHSWPGGDGYVFVQDGALNVYAPPLLEQFQNWSFTQNGVEKTLYPTSPWDWIEFHAGRGLVLDVTQAGQQWGLSLDMSLLREAQWDTAYSNIVQYASNWQTAYGWGNHALEGYLKTYDPNDSVQPSELDGTFSTIGLLKRTGASTYTTITDNSANWNTAYTERRQWDGGPTNLDAATGRNSLGLGSAALHLATDFAESSHNHGTGTTDYLTKWSNTSGGLTDSILSESGGRLVSSGDISIGTGPIDYYRSINISNDNTNGHAILRAAANNGGQSAVELVNYRGSLSTGAYFSASNARGTYTSPQTVQNGDRVGAISAGGYNASASMFTMVSSIQFFVDGEPATGGDTTDMPGRLVFLTTPDGSGTSIERVRIDNDGDVGINITDVKYKLDLNGTARATLATATQTASHVITQSNSNNVLQWRSLENFKTDLGAATWDTAYANIVNSGSNWTTAYNERRQWDGGAAGLDAATGRNSLGLGSAALSLATDFAAAVHNHGTGTTAYVPKFANGTTGELADSGLSFTGSSANFAGAINGTLGSSYLSNFHTRDGYVLDTNIIFGSHNELAMAHARYTVSATPSISVINLFRDGDSYTAVTDAQVPFSVVVEGSFPLGSAPYYFRPWVLMHLGRFSSITVDIKDNNGQWITNQTVNNNDKLFWIGVPLGTYAGPIKGIRFTFNNPSTSTVYIRDLGLYYPRSRPWRYYLSNEGDSIYGSLNFAGVTKDLTTPAGEHLAIIPGSGGGVGIKTTTPEYDLDVDGNARANKVYFPDTYGDKLILKSNLYGVNVDVNEFNLFSDRYFTMSSDTNADAFIFDADTGSLTSKGNIIINGIYYGDGSGLNYVDADTLEGRSGNDFVERIGDSMYGDLDMTTAKVIFDVSPDIKISFGNPYRIETRSNTLVFRTDNKFLFENGSGFPVLEMNHSEDEIIAYTNLNLSSKNINDVNKAKVNSIVFRTARTEATASQLLAALEDGEMVLWKPSGGPLALAVKYGTNDLRWQNLITAAGAEDWPEDVHALGIEYDGTVYRAQVHTGY